ncbi:hypothetical protein ACSTS3_20385 [Aquimarina muelleri]|uniref:hypothetical protein n=1 Tax=Aquimarina muelleri TaxID=279356 RepID=UPI003F68644C
MTDCYENLDSYWTKTKLSTTQNIKIHCTAIIITVLKLILKPIRILFNKSFDLLANTNDYLGDFEALGSKRKEEFGENYLTESEIQQFLKSGIHGPFRVLATDEAEDLANDSDTLFHDNFHKTTAFGDDILNSLKVSGNYSINYLGFFQGSKYRKIWDVLVHPKIAQPLQSILGDDLLCWRSQFFEKNQNKKEHFGIKLALLENLIQNQN